MDDLVLLKLALQGVEGAVIHDGVFKTCVSAPTSLTIPKGVKVLGNGCLSGQDSLEVLILPRTIEFVGDFVLANCSNLRLIKCFDNVKCFEDKLLYGNSAEIRVVEKLEKLDKEQG